MWEKAIAGTLIILGTQGLGLTFCQEIQSKIYHEKEEKQMLLYINREIDFLHRPMMEIFEGIKERVKEPYQSFLKEVAIRMGSGEGQSLQCVWREETQKLEHKGMYPKEAICYLYRIGECFGCEEDELQISTLSLLQKELEEDIEKMKKTKEEKGRMIQTLSLLAGIFCVVIFI